MDRNTRWMIWNRWTNVIFKVLKVLEMFTRAKTCLLFLGRFSMIRDALFRQEPSTTPVLALSSTSAFDVAKATTLASHRKDPYSCQHPRRG